MYKFICLLLLCFSTIPTGNKATKVWPMSCNNSTTQEVLSGHDLILECQIDAKFHKNWGNSCFVDIYTCKSVRKEQCNLGEKENERPALNKTLNVTIFNVTISEKYIIDILTNCGLEFNATFKVNVTDPPLVVSPDTQKEVEGRNDTFIKHDTTIAGAVAVASAGIILTVLIACIFCKRRNKISHNSRETPIDPEKDNKNDNEKHEEQPLNPC